MHIQSLSTDFYPFVMDPMTYKSSLFYTIQGKPLKFEHRWFKMECNEQYTQQIKSLEGTKSSTGDFLPNKDTNFYTIPNETGIFIGFNKSSEKKIEKKNVVMSKKIMVKMTTMTNISILHALKIKDMLPTKNHKWCVCQGFQRNVMYHFA